MIKYLIDERYETFQEILHLTHNFLSKSSHGVCFVIHDAYEMGDA